MTAQTIDEVIDQLTGIVEQSRTQAARAGYFAALYRRVTQRVKDGIIEGRFEDGSRMEKLDVAFANRYLEAYDQYQRGDACSQTWQVALDACRSDRHLILQHLLLGMNAHINLDLAVAAAQVAPGADLPALAHDFTEINRVLAELVDDVQRQIAHVSPWFGWLDWFSGRTDEVLVNFSMEKARQSAWAFAEQLAPLDADGQAALLAARDAQYARFARVVLSPPGSWLALGLFLIWLRESREAPYVIDVLGV